MGGCPRSEMVKALDCGIVVSKFEFQWRYYVHFRTNTLSGLNNRAIGLMSRVFANGPGDRGSIPGRVIAKTQKMVLDFSLLNTQHYKVRIKGKVEQSRERSSNLPYTLM